LFQEALLLTFSFYCHIDAESLSFVALGKHGTPGGQYATAHRQSRAFGHHKFVAPKAW